VLTAAKRSVAAIIDLFPSWQPCETRSYTQKKKRTSDWKHMEFHSGTDDNNFIMFSEM